MDVTAFAELVGKIPFLIFPAVRLQQTLREKFGGKNLWGSVAMMLVERMQHDKNEEQKTLFNKRKEFQKEKELEFKLKQYAERSAEWWESYNKREDKLRDPLR